MTDGGSGYRGNFRFYENTIGFIRCHRPPFGASKLGTGLRLRFGTRDNLLLLPNRRYHISSDMDVRDGAVEGGVEHEIATGTHVEDGIIVSLYDVAVKGHGALVGYKMWYVSFRGDT